MYDGSTAAAEAVLMAQRVTKRGKAVLSGGLHPHYRETIETLARMRRRDEIVGAAAGIDAEAARICAPIDADTACVVVQTPDVFGHVHDLTPIAEAAHAAGALLIVGGHRGVSLGLLEVAGRDGRRHRRRRGPVDRQRPELRRALCRPVRHAREVRAPDAGPPVRRDGGRRGPARLRADAVDPRAAHPPREGDLATSAPTPASARWPSRST